MPQEPDNSAKEKPELAAPRPQGFWYQVFVGAMGAYAAALPAFIWAIGNHKVSSDSFGALIVGCTLISGGLVSWMILRAISRRWDEIVQVFKTKSKEERGSATIATVAKMILAGVITIGVVIIVPSFWGYSILPYLLDTIRH